jgi:uncharacterized protein (DUF486 family)
MWKVVLLLSVANVFMTFAWYGHLRHQQRGLALVVLASWGIALVEYCFQVPANRLGHQLGYSAAHLKTVQEVITLLVFAGFSVLYLGEPLRWNVVVGFALVACGATFVFEPWKLAHPEPARAAASATTADR